MDSVRSFGTNFNPFKSTTPTSSYSDFSMNNIVIIVTFGIMVYVLVQMLIVLNRPEFLYYTLSPIPTDLDNETFGKVNYSEKLPLAKLNEFTYSFWVYLREVKSEPNADDTDNPKPQLLFMRNKTSNEDFFNANPVVYIKNNTNTMKIALRTGESTDTGLDDIHQNSSDAYEHFIIEYIPVKRWVNVMINVDNKRVTIFLDGEIVETRILDNSVSETNGDVYLGKNSDIITPNALISKIQFYNYSIRTPNDIRKIYDDGPIKKQTVMRMLGLPNIGVRSPIYNLEKSCDN